MPDLEVIIFNHKIKLSYQENEKERLIKAVETLNQNWKKYSYLQGKVSDIKIITLISLELQDSITNTKSIKDNHVDMQLKIDLLEKEIEKKNKEISDSLDSFKKIELELHKKNEEMLKADNMIDNIHNELQQIKKNILDKK